MVNDRWEQAEVPGHPGHIVTRDRFTRGQVSVFHGGELVAAGVAFSDSLAHAVDAAVRYLDGPPPEQKPSVAAPAVPAGKVHITAAQALAAGLITEKLLDMLGPDTMVEVS